METTDKTMYLQRRDGVYYFRRRIPKNIKNLLTKGERGAFHQSLETKNRSRAIELLAARITHTKEIERRANERGSAENRNPVHSSDGLLPRRKRLPKVKFSKSFYQLSEHEIIELGNRWFASAFAKIREYALDVHVQYNDEGREDVLEQWGEELDLLQAGRNEGRAQLMHREIMLLLGDEDCAPPDEWIGHERFRKFYNRIQQGMIHHRNVAMKIVEHGIKQEIAPERGGEVVTMAATFPASPNGKQRTLDDVIEEFKANEKRQPLREKTNKEYNLIYRALREFIGGERPLSSIIREDVRSLADGLRALPAFATSKFPKMSLPEIAKMAKEKGLTPAHPKSYNKKIHSISAIFKYAEGEGYIVTNPARSLAIPVKKTSGHGKKHSTEALKKIFSNSSLILFVEREETRFTPNHGLKPCLFWAPLIALFTGMRSNEILQLGATTGVLQIDGVDTFQLIEQVKNESSFRTVPIHSELKRLGLMRYVQNVREAGHDKLFPDAQRGSDGNYSTWFQKPFARYLKKIGVKKGRNECFHSFRHNFISELRRADVPEDVRKALTGHSTGDSHAGYGEEAIKRNSDYLERVRYEGVSLTHLYPEKN